MKKLFTLSISVIFITGIAGAQIKKGSTLLGGQISFSNNNDYNDRSDHSATFNVSAGKAVKQNTAVGVTLAYSASKYENIYNGISHTDLKAKFYSAGVFYRKYKKLAKDLYFFTELNASYNYADQNYTDSLGHNTDHWENRSGQLAVTPGISYKLYRKLHVELLIPSVASIQYSVARTTTGDKREQLVFNTNLTSNPLSNLGVGFRLIL